MLYRYGVIDESVLERILVLVKTGKRFGQAAIELGVLTQDQIFKYISKQVDEIVFATREREDAGLRP